MDLIKLLCLLFALKLEAHDLFHALFFSSISHTIIYSSIFALKPLLMLLEKKKYDQLTCVLRREKII